MPEIKILTESDLKSIVKLDLEVVDCIESAFATLAEGKVVMPPILSMAIEANNGEVDVKTAYVPGIDSFAIKVSPGFFDNPKFGLPSTSGLMILFSSKTGMVEALLLDNGYLTNVRTAAAGAVAARWLARENAEIACVIGAGTQARLQLEALCLVRSIKKAFIWSPDEQESRIAAEELVQNLQIEVENVDDLSKTAAQADVILTTTPAKTPLIEADWLSPGQHITAMGSDQHDKNELHPECLKKADLYVPDRCSQTAVLGELHHALEAGIFDESDTFPELAEIVSRKNPGRISPEQITICDLTGTGLQDTAIATLARQRAQEAAIGTQFNN